MIVNPNASGTTPRVRDVIAHALGAIMKIDVAETQRRHHATELAAGAVAGGYTTVISLGGDGTLNEVVNGLLGHDVTLIVLPGGHTNVFARTWGLPRDPVEATSVILQMLEAGVQPSAMDSGSINGRAFSFNAGIGFDADVVRSVEARPRWKRRFGERFFVLQGFRRFFVGYPRRPRPLDVRVGGEHHPEARQVFLCVSDPYTYLGERPFRLCPGAGRAPGLSMTTLTSMSTVTALRILTRAFGRARLGRLSGVHLADGVAHAQITAGRPMPYQVDGDYAGESTSFEVAHLPGALRVLIPPPNASP